MKYLIFIFLLLFFSATIFANTPTTSSIKTQPKELRIVRITPQGSDVPPGRQIVIEFNRPVVAIGPMQRAQSEIPAEFTPSVNCQWRWLNTSALSCNLDEKNALKPATLYQLTIKSGIKAQDGATIAQTYQHSFVTQRPQIKSVYVDNWTSPGMPVIKLLTNLSVTQESLSESLVFIAGNKTYQVKVLPDLTPQYEYDRYGEGKLSQAPSNDGRRWIITPKEELPLASSFVLHLMPGLVTDLGPEKSVVESDLVKTTTFPEFAFLGINCFTNAGAKVFFSDKTPQQKNPLCNPLLPISLVFNTPVLRSAVKENVQFTPALQSKGTTGDIWNIENEYHYDKIYRQDAYTVWLPWVKPAQKYIVFVPSTPSPLTDIFGRKLSKPMTLTFTTDHRKPNYEMVYHDAVLEKNINSEVPIYVNNLKSITFQYRSVTHVNQENASQKNTVTSNQTVAQKIPQVKDIQFAVPLNVRAMLHGHSGAIYGTLTSEPFVKKYGNEKRLFAQVTPFQLQVKLGYFNSLVWVKELATGNPVSNAKITIYQDALSELSAPQKIFATAITDKQGIAILPGTSEFDPELTLYRTWEPQNQRLFFRVDKDQDMAVMPISYDFAIDTWRVSDGQVSENKQPLYGHLLAWGITAQGIYRLGDTIQYKFYVRDQDNQKLIPPPTSGYTLQIIDPTNKVVAEVDDLTLSAFGAYQGEFTIPQNAAMGWYQFRLLTHFDPSKNNLNSVILDPMRVLVSDFTPAPFKVSNEINGDLFHAQAEVSVLTSAKLHSGGPYTEATARITANLESADFTSSNPIAQNFTFGSYIEAPSSDSFVGKSIQIYQKISPLNDKGELQTTFTIPKQAILYGKLKIESAVQDERGKYIATQNQADYVGSDRFVGLRATQWVYNAKKPGIVKYIVTDERGNPVAGTAVDIVIERQVTQAARVKDAGNAYTTHYTSSWEKESACKGVSEKAPLDCPFTPQKTGDYRITAAVKDSKGNSATAKIPIWVVGSDYVLWNESSDNYLQILPEKPQYHIHDVARFMVKNPYPGAQALITIERYGVLDYFVQTFDTSSPIVEIPIKPDYLPGVYVSITVFSPRVDKPLENAQVDLGKPTFRIGYVTLPVKDNYKEMQVTAGTDRAIYKPRETVQLQIHAQPKMPAIQSEPIELSVAVVDESVFALLTGGKNNYDPYAGFYHLDGLDIGNYSLLTRLIGRQKFEKKGANPGGDGGVDLGLRNVFKFVSYWNPSIQADAKGNATVKFAAPDNLTGWRVLVLAVTRGDRMGLGDSNFKVNRPTELRPVMPNQVTEGDDFKAGFSILNRTDTQRTLHVSITATGNLDVSKTPDTFTQDITLPPFKRTTVWMPIHTSPLLVIARSETTKQSIHFTARAGDNMDHDALEFELPVEKMRSLETAANYGTTTANQVEEPLHFPEHIYTDVGQVSVVVAPSVIADVEGAFRYMKDYPYLCWEQILTKGVMAAHYQQLKPYLPTRFSWAESDTLPKTTLNLAANFQAPNGAMAYFDPSDQRADPYLSAYTALAFNWLRQEGQVIPEQVEQKLHAYLLNLLRRDIAPDYYTPDMTSTVRAVALAALAEKGEITLADLKRYQPYVPHMSLFGKANFVKAATQIKEGYPIAIEVAKMILAQSNQTGGKFMFNETLDDGYTRILATPLRDNCAILDAFTDLAATPSGKEFLSDVPFKLVRMISQARKDRDHWENTQENMFCMHALVNYSHIYESVAPNMTVNASMDNQTFAQAHLTALTNPPVTFTRPIQAQDPGRTTKVVINRKGNGRLYYATQLSYASKSGFDEPVNAGIDIHREYSVQRGGKWVLLHNPMQIKQGELLRVDIYLSLPTARNFVVVNDPVPGGLEPVNRQLATSSTVDADQGNFKAAEGSIWFKFNDWVEYNVSFWSFYHQELHNNAAQFYADYLPAGNYHLSYTAQAIASGQFTVMPIKAEEMYDPDVFGRGIKVDLRVDS